MILTGYNCCSPNLKSFGYDFHQMFAIIFLSSEMPRRFPTFFQNLPIFRSGHDSERACGRQSCLACREEQENHREHLVEVRTNLLKIWRTTSPCFVTCWLDWVLSSKKNVIIISQVCFGRVPVPAAKKARVINRPRQDALETFCPWTSTSKWIFRALNSREQDFEGNSWIKPLGWVWERF